MLYLLDANVLIRAHEDYYPIDRVPQFWSWLKDMGISGRVKIPFEIYDELSVYAGPLKDWVTDSTIKGMLLLAERINPDHLNKVISVGYASDLDDSEIEEIGRDPFLVGYALSAVSEITVVTKEVSKPSKQRANRKIPDVCNAVGVRCISDFQFYRELQFTTV